MNKTNFILKVTIILWIIIFIFSLVCFTFSAESKVETKSYEEAAFEGKEIEILDEDEVLEVFHGLGNYMKNNSMQEFVKDFDLRPINL